MDEPHASVDVFIAICTSVPFLCYGHINILILWHERLHIRLSLPFT